MAGKARYAVLAAATVCSLSCGLQYCFSAWAPQLASRLDLNSTQINSIGACGNLGVYLSSPLIGRIVDRRGPKPTLFFAAVALCSGYLVIRAFYTTGDDHESGLFARFGVPGLVLAELLTGIGSTAGLSSAGNSVAKSFNKRRAAALSVVLSAFGLSAFFYSSLSSLFLHPRADTDVTSSFLLLLALGSLLSMLVGLLFVRPIPRETRLPASDAREAEEAPVEAEATLPEAEEQVGASGTERTPLLRSTSSKSIEERNIAGWALLRELDFYLIFLFNGLCAGVGLCYINNLGQVVRSLALAAPIHPSLPSSFAGPSPATIALLQARLVSLLSLFNFLGRLLSGFTSDYLLHHPSYRLPRVFFLPLTAALYLASQLVATRVTSTSALWAPTALTGLAHGCLFGISGIVGLERFGMRSFSQTNGVLALAPALFGQATNLIFGRIYDSRSHPVPSLVGSSAPSLTCTLGRACYLPAFELTSAMSLCALGVGLWLAIGRGAMRVRAA